MTTPLRKPRRAAERVRTFRMLRTRSAAPLRVAASNDCYALYIAKRKAARAAEGELVFLSGALMLEAESTLVSQAQRGDRAAFEELVRRVSRLVYARLYLETGDAHQAEDLLQETLLTAYKTIGQLTEPGKFRSWL